MTNDTPRRMLILAEVQADGSTYNRCWAISDVLSLTIESIMGPVQGEAIIPAAAADAAAAVAVVVDHAD